MNAKRFLSVLIAVVVMVISIPISVLAAPPASHPATDFRTIKFHPMNPSSVAPSNLEYDVIIIRYEGLREAGWDVHSYQFYFCKNSQIRYDTFKDKYTSLNVNGASYANIPMVWVKYSEGHSNARVRDSFGYYPESVGYLTYSLGALRVDTPVNEVQVEIVINNPNNSFTQNELPPPPPPPDPPPPPPDPPIPPPPPVPPMVIPPHNPEMVPWDGEKIREFFTYVSNATGNIVNVGLAYFGIILAVYVVIRIVKRYDET